MTGYSLHIGLNHVDPNAYGGWDGALGGCVNDANSMQQLAAAAGFTTAMLLDGQATSQAVVGGIARLAQQACPGDICLVTYSGHGGQVDDWNSEEEDAQDETWVLYDRQVVDDELFQMWSQFAAGVRVLVLSDSCHSGTVAKMMIARESRQAMTGKATREVAPQLSVVTTPKSMPFDVQTRDNEQRRGTYEFVQALSGSRELCNVSASVLLISGCQDNQLSYDGPVNGQFTGTLLRVWNNGGFSGDYTAFHAAILAQMPPDQSPNLFQTGASDPAFLGQRPFTITAPAGSLPIPSNGLPSTTQPTRPTLRQGDSGPDVVYLQQRLNAYGASLTADGMFGPMTTAAVRTFQAGHGLMADGVVGPQTWNALGTAPVSGASSTGNGVPNGVSGGGSTGGGTAVVARPTVRRGSTGPDVQYLQGRLSSLGYWVAVDGIFGPGTESTVRSFQASNGLPADGVVGPQTWAAVG